MRGELQGRIREREDAVHRQVDHLHQVVGRLALETTSALALYAHLAVSDLLAEIPGEADQLDPGIGPARGFQHGAGIIGAVIVHEDDLVAVRQLRQDPGQPPDQLGQIRLGLIYVGITTVIIFSCGVVIPLT